MRWAWASAVAAVAVALGVAAFVWDAPAHHSSGRSAPAPQIAGRPAPSPAPPDTAPVTFHGLTIDVPKSWTVGPPDTCDAPAENAVTFGDGAHPACGSTGTNSFSSAEFRSWYPGNASGVPSQRLLTIDAHAATVHAGLVYGVHTTELVVPDLRAMVTISSPDPTLGERLVRTAEITRSDRYGCPSTMGYVDLTAPPTSGPSNVMVAGRPSVVVICTYVQNFLERGVALSTVDATRLIDALNALPTGLSEASPKDYLPSLCRGGKLARQGDSSDLQGYAIRISYAYQPPSIVYARLSLCGALGFTNGTRTGQVTNPVAELLVGLSGFDTVWQGGLHPRG